MLLFELSNMGEAQMVRHELRAMFASKGYDFDFDSHTLHRLINRDRKITVEEMLHTFDTLFAKHVKPFKRIENRDQASIIVKDTRNNNNYTITFVKDRATMTTAMKKKEFRTDHDRQQSVIVKI